MILRTKVFQSGNSQAIRIPKELRLDCDEVEIEKVGDELVIKKIDGSDKWDKAFESLKALKGIELDISDMPLQERDIF